MTTTANPGPGEEWRLGGEPSAPSTPHEQEPSEPAEDRSRQALERSIMVLTVEHLAWSLVAVWVLLTRIVALGTRPLSDSEARNALFEFDLANETAHAAAAGFHPVSAGWVHLLEAGLFAVIGAGDSTARIGFALSGVLIVAMAFAMRPYVGRAGAIALGTMFAISPSITYFSRDASTVTPASAMALVAITLFMALIQEPERRRALRLGFVGGLMVSAGSAGVVDSGAFVVALAALGLWELVATRKAFLRLRVWMDRYAGLAALTIVAAAAVALLSEGVLPGIVMRIRTTPGLVTAALPGYARGIAFYGLPLVLYEFLIVILAAVGALLIISLRIRSYFAWWCLIWTAATVAFYLWIPVRTPATTMVMIVPAAFLGAFAVEHLHHMIAWRYVRYAVAAIALFSVYVQILTNFIYFAPDATEAQWSRHANLAWRDGATTLQSAELCREIAKRFSRTQASVYFHESGARSGTPALRWYLRSLTPADDADMASVVVEVGVTQTVSADLGSEPRYEFDFEEAWQPDPDELDTARALRYLLTAQLWGPVAITPAVITVRSTGASSPTIILPPGASH
jgi:hypothetical protein